MGDNFLKLSTRNIRSPAAAVKGFGARGGFFAGTKVTGSINYRLGLDDVCFYEVFLVPLR